MKRPLLEEFDRWAIREAPHTLYAIGLKIYLARMHLRREIDRAICK